MKGNMGVSQNIWQRGDFAVTILNRDLETLAATVRKYVDLSYIIDLYHDFSGGTMDYYPDSTVNLNKVPIKVSISSAKGKEDYAVTVRFTQATRTGEAVLIQIAEALDIRVKLDLNYDFRDVVKEREELMSNKVQTQ